MWDSVPARSSCVDYQCASHPKARRCTSAATATLSYRSLDIHYGLPFGQDRIVPIYLATLAVRQQSQTIRFRTAAEMLETFGLHKAARNTGG